MPPSKTVAVATATEEQQRQQRMGLKMHMFSSSSIFYNPLTILKKTRTQLRLLPRQPYPTTTTTQHATTPPL